MRQVIADLATVTGHQGRFVCAAPLRRLIGVGRRQRGIWVDHATVYPDGATLYHRVHRNPEAASPALPCDLTERARVAAPWNSSCQRSARDMPIEADHSRLKSATSPVGGLERLRSAQSVSAGTLRTKHAPRPLGSRHHGDPLRPVPDRLRRSCSPRLRRPRHGPLLPPTSQRKQRLQPAQRASQPGSPIRATDPLPCVDRAQGHGLLV